MWYRAEKDSIIDYSNYKFSDECKYTDIVTKSELDRDIDLIIVEDYNIKLNPNYLEIKEKREKERVSNLHCTKRVLALVLKELGVSYANLQTLIATNEDAQLEWDLCVELERSNPLLDILGAQLGISSTTIDKIFKYANGEIGKEDFDETDIVKGGIANG